MIEEILKDFVLAFIPLVVAFDALGILPIFISLTKELEPKDVHKVVWQSTLTAFIIAVIFLFIGSAIFSVLGITVSDFQIAGGLVLLLVSLSDLMGVKFKSDREGPSTVGVVPIGMPLILGPAALTTVVMLGGSLKWGYVVLPAAVLVNMIIIFVVFFNARGISRRLGPAISAAVSKVMGLLIAAYAIMMIRVGILAVFADFTAKAAK